MLHPLIEAVPGFTYDVAMGAYILDRDPRVAVEVVMFKKLAPTVFWTATVNGDPWHMAASPLDGMIAAAAARTLSMALDEWPQDWSVWAEMY